MGGSRPSGTNPAESDIQEYEMSELNTEKVSIANICSKPDIAIALADMVKKDNRKKLQGFFMSGKKFSDAIKQARAIGKKFIRYSGILINIQLDQKMVTINEFTKQRFLAACHMQLYESGLAAGFCSPLVTRIDFNESNPLTEIKSLLGAGFQFLGRVIKKSVNNDVKAILLFHLGCFALDYIWKTSPYKDAATGHIMDAELDPTKYTFIKYILSRVA